MRMLVGGLGGLLRAQGALIGVILLMFALFVAQLAGPEGWYEPLMVVPVEVTAAWKRLVAGDAAAGDGVGLASLVGYAFLHGDLFHLLGNLLYLWIFGALLSEIQGWRWMLAIGLVTALGAAIVHVAMDPDERMPMLGASGVVMGFMGAYVGLAVRWKLPDPHVWPMARPIPPAHLALLGVIFLALDYQAIFGGSLENIAFGAHVGGFTTGLAMTALVTPPPRVARR